MRNNENQFLNVGFGNYVNKDRVMSILTPSTSGIKRVLTQAKESGNLIDVTSGRKARSIVLLDDNTVYLCALNAQTLDARSNGEEDK
jgi:Uncharacterized protein conserved in bacteria